MEHGKLSSRDKYIGLNTLIIKRGAVLAGRDGPFLFLGDIDQTFWLINLFYQRMAKSVLISYICDSSKIVILNQ